MLHFPAYATPEENVRALVRRLGKELPNQITGKVEYTETIHDGGPPVDPRSALRKFVESTVLCAAARTLTLDVPLGSRLLTVAVAIGGQPHVHHPVCLGLTLSTPTRLPALPRVQDPALRRLLRSLLVGDDASFTLVAAGGTRRIVARTLPQETWGGFVMRLGAALFLDAVFRAEVLATAEMVAAGIAAG